MRRDAIVGALAGVFFGLLVGWILGSQQDRGPAVATKASTSAAAPAPEGPNRAPVAIDTQRVAALEQRASAAPQDAAVRTELGNLYLDANRPDLAIPWYEAAWRLNPKNADVSTDLGVAYFQTNQIDRALAQLELSIAADPRHAKALLNQGIVYASGKKDFAAAAASLKKVVDTAPPASEEARIAREALSAIAEHVKSGKSSDGKSGGRP